MERRDYLLLEIEKIGLVLTAIKQKLFGGKENLAITVNKQMEETKDILLNGLNFEFDKFLTLDMDESIQYLDSFNGFNVENTDELAGFFLGLGIKDNSSPSKEYLEKALQLYTISNLKSKTYSMEREMHIMKIKNALESI
ncbi:MAG TPA: hypothetical protein DEP71_09120 [Porphyromonadaceae bacterium]|jgi:hypothetical protein|uniref:hypothetical protein n=1 Tax=Petrimonas TaxID=307628 RepID=UPI000E85E56C|nr:hypothetical protein [Petrimonas sp.]HBC39500.1 hypothetical protein [Porphyromonadaceae bacterium]MEA4995483.1 hypothetical protein [Petrimonas sp.]HBF95552.1 hypothetical protein [Porphyromonadaceae bacterium]HBG80503.1 hypothetical protein [Porphyromonadaceae bacterium]